MNNPSMAVEVKARSIKDAVQAHTTLCLFEAAAMMLEGSDVRGERARRVAERVIGLLRAEEQNLLRDYDKAVAEIKEPAHG